MWPDGLRVGPIREWPGALTPSGQRQSSKFKTHASGSSYRRVPTALSDTTELLKRELKALGAKNAEMLIAMRPEDFRNDGYPRATAKAAHPGIILSFDSSVGHLSYPCDTFTTWQDNLRAVALALEALRKVDRYGVTKNGQQYKGFLELEAPKPGYLSSTEAAVHYLEELTGADRGVETPKYLLRLAQRNNHPDRGGPEVRPIWDALQEIEAFLRANGHLG
jgi:hypothetical protein